MKIGDVIKSDWLNSVNGVGVISGKRIMDCGVLVYYIEYIDSFNSTIYTYECAASILMSRSNICEI